MVVQSIILDIGTIIKIPQRTSYAAYHTTYLSVSIEIS
jgi:hypothetical protein